MNLKVFNRVKRNNIYTSSWIVLIIDLSLIVQSFVVANLLYYNFKLQIYDNFILHQTPFIIVIAFISFMLIGSHKGTIRHTGLDDAVNVFIAISLFSFLSIFAIYLNRNLGVYKIPVFIPHSLSILLIHYILSLVILISSRFVFKRMYQLIILDKKASINTLIYGAGDSGLITAATIANDKGSKFRVVGFIDDNPSKIGKQFNRIKVYAIDKISEEFIAKHNIKEVIISIQNTSNISLLKISDSLTKKNVSIKIVPPVDSWMDGGLKVSQIKNLKVEDLLERAPIELNNPTLKKEFHQKIILITGAAGSIGSEITNQIAQYNYTELLILDQAESPLYDLQQDLKRKGITNYQTIIADVRNKSSLEKIFNKYAIDIVFHAAAYKHVPLMENNPYEAVNVNVAGTKNVMDLSVKYDVKKFVMISTDKAVNPTNVMGATKRVAEIYAKCLQNRHSTKFITTRFGNVLGSNGSVIPLFKKQIELGGPLTVTHKDITRYFMTIPEACQLVLEAGAMGNGGEIYVFDMGESVKIYDVAKKMIALSGFKYPEEIDIKIVGLRPGEKLYEELLSNEENTITTYHEKIMIAKVNEKDFQLMEPKINALANLTNKSNVEIVSQIKALIPEYISNNSEFEKLD